MNDSPGDYGYPRQLLPRERELIEWILPEGAPGYRAYRELIAGMVVLGEGRRGEGEIILGPRGMEPDFSSPLAPLLAYGSIEYSEGTASISLREILDGQISVEIVGPRSEGPPPTLGEVRSWTCSPWKPGSPCPQCGRGVREVPMHSTGGRAGHLALAICPFDRRLWLYDASTEINRLIPVTNFYNEIMLHKNIRDPRVALDSRRLFEDLASYSDSDLTYAFVTYNKLRAKVRVEGTIEPDRSEKRRAGAGFLKRFMKT